MLLFLVDLINIEKFRISFRFFYSFSFILRSRATSVTQLHLIIKNIHNNRNSKRNYIINLIPVIIIRRYVEEKNGI